MSLTRLDVFARQIDLKVAHGARDEGWFSQPDQAVLRDQLNEVAILATLAGEAGGDKDVAVSPGAKIAASARSAADAKSAAGAKYKRGIAVLLIGADPVRALSAAQSFASVIRRELYHVDVLSIVSKYIGETEKNLQKLFDAAQEGGAVLLFDEADALFGKRTEARDSHDRYANLEVSYLLDRIESNNGVVILATNRKSTIDPAILRRIRFAIDFTPMQSGPKRTSSEGPKKE